MTSPAKVNLVIKVDNEPVTPISKFNPSFAVPVTPVHSLEADNVGFLAQPSTFTFTLEVQATGPTVAKLTDMALKRTAFTIEASQEVDNNWTYSSLVFNDCFITQMDHTTAPNTAPITTIKGICLKVVPTARTA